MSKLWKTAQAETGSCLTKVAAAKGKLQASFYWAGNTSGKTARLAMTLTARDPKGAKVLARGKGLKKEVPGAKTARGVVVMEGAKLVFEIHAGNATPGVVKKSLQKTLAALDGLGLLKKAVVCSAGDDREALEGEDVAGSDVEMTASAVFALAADVAAQKRMGSLNAQLAGFLDTDAAQAEANAAVLAALDRLRALSAVSYTHLTLPTSG